MNKIRKIFESDMVFFVISIFILTLAFSLNITRFTTNINLKNIDSYSEGIMIADLMYNNHYNNDTLFLKGINSDLTFTDGSTGTYDEIYNKYIKNETYQKNQYFTYTSNITADRILYNWIDNLIDNKTVVINVIKLINALFLAIVTTIILLWIKNVFSFMTSYSVLLVLAFLCPNFVGFGTNLYWITGSLFLPTASSFWVLSRNTVSKTRKFYILVFGVSYVSCLIKQLFYFEFVSSVMISMIVPYIYYSVIKKLTLKDTLKLYILPTSGAVLSFLTTCFIKILMLSKNFYWKNAVKEFLSPILYRLIGSSDSGSDTINASAHYPLAFLLNDMLSQVAISIKGIINISQSQLILISIIIFLIYYYSCREIDKKIISFIISLFVACLAPLSWFILAKPHSVVHEWLCSILWFLPLNIFILSFDIYLLFNLLLKYIKGNKYLLIKKIKLTLICFVLGGLTFYMSINISNYKELNMTNVYLNGLELYKSNDIKILYYNDSLYYVTSKNIKDKFFLHIIPKDYNELSDDYKSLGYANFDFNFNDLKIEQPYKIGINSIAKINLPSYEISKIKTGQFEIRNSEYKFLWQEEFDMNDLLYIPDGFKLTPYDLNDKNWNNGISKDGYILLIKDYDNKFKSLIGRTIISSTGEKAIVKDIQFTSDGWIYVILDTVIKNDKNMLTFTVQKP